MGRDMDTNKDMDTRHILVNTCAVALHCWWGNIVSRFWG
jgi:hypothetical protein